MGLGARVAAAPCGWSAVGPRAPGRRGARRGRRGISFSRLTKCKAAGPSSHADRWHRDRGRAGSPLRPPGVLRPSRPRMRGQRADTGRVTAAPSTPEQPRGTPPRSRRGERARDHPPPSRGKRRAGRLPVPQTECASTADDVRGLSSSWAPMRSQGATGHAHPRHIHQHAQHGQGHLEDARPGYPGADRQRGDGGWPGRARAGLRQGLAHGGRDGRRGPRCTRRSRTSGTRGTSAWGRSTRWSPAPATTSRRRMEAWRPRSWPSCEGAARRIRPTRAGADPRRGAGGAARARRKIRVAAAWGPTAFAWPMPQ